MKPIEHDDDADSEREYKRNAQDKNDAAGALARGLGRAL